jgi:hypothetical protein
MARRRGMGSHQSSAAVTDEWLTPPELLQALGPFDLDPCSPAPERRPWPTAARHYSLPFQDGLVMPWEGRVFLNPPYGNVLERWMERMAGHGDGVALIFARTETAAFQRWVWPVASALLFIDGRLHFHHAVTGQRAVRNAGAPSVLVAYDQMGVRNLAALRDSGLSGAWLDCRRGLVMVPSNSWSTWRERVLGHLRQMGRATLNDLYAAVGQDPSVPATNRHVRAKVRQMLYRFARRDGEHWMAA